MDRNEKGKDGVVLFEKRFLLITFIVSTILLIISLIYRNPILAICCKRQVLFPKFRHLIFPNSLTFFFRR